MQAAPSSGTALPPEPGETLTTATAVLDHTPLIGDEELASAGLPVGPGMYTATTDASATAGRSLRARLASLLSSGKDLGPYVGYVGYFVGAGLISGGIVHYPLEPARYTAIAVTGIVVFLCATLFNEVLMATERLPRMRLLRVVASSLLLSLGVGMLSGGIQHFNDFPARAATLIPTGLVVSYAAFQVRNAERSRAALRRPATLLVLVVAVALVPGLRSLVPAGPAVAHDHGAASAAATPTDHADDHGAPAPAPAAEQAATTLPGSSGTTAPAAPATEKLTEMLAKLATSLAALEEQARAGG